MTNIFARLPEELQRKIWFLRLHASFAEMFTQVPKMQFTNYGNYHHVHVLHMRGVQDKLINAQAAYNIYDFHILCKGNQTTTTSLGNLNVTVYTDTLAKY